MWQKFDNQKLPPPFLIFLPMDKFIKQPAAPGSTLGCLNVQKIIIFDLKNMP